MMMIFNLYTKNLENPEKGYFFQKDKNNIIN